MPVIDARHGTPLGGQLMLTADEQAHQLAMLAERMARSQQMAEQRARQQAMRAATEGQRGKGMTIEDRLALMMAEQEGRRGDLRLQSELRAGQADADHGRTMERDTAARAAAQRIAELDAERRMKEIERQSELASEREATGRTAKQNDPLYQAQLEQLQFVNQNARQTADDRKPADREQAAHERALDMIQMQNTGQRPGGEGENAMPQSAREALAMQAAQSGDFESYQAIMGGADPQATPFFRKMDAMKQQGQQDAREALVNEAANMLDQDNAFFSLLPGKKEPWQESGNVFSGDFWNESRDKQLKRANALMARHPRFRQMGITAEELVNYYQKNNRWAP